MGRDSQTKMSKKESIKSKRKEESTKRKKINHESSDDDDSLYTDDDSENELDVLEYRKFLKNMFPSKHLDKKIKSGERLKQAIKENESEEDIEESEEEEEEIKSKKSKKNIKKNKQKNLKVESSEEEEESEADEEEEMPRKHKYNTRKKHIVVSEDDETEDNETEDDETETNESGKGKTNKFNIIFTIGGRKKDEDFEDEDEDEDDEDWSTCSESNTENEDDPISTDEDTDTCEDEDDDEEEISKKKKLSKKDKKMVKEVEDKSNTEKKENDNDELIDKLKDVLGVKKTEKLGADGDLILMLKDLQSRNKNSELIKECVRVCQDKIKINKEKEEKKVKKEKDRNSRIFKRILRDKNTMNDFEFYDKLETVNQKKIIKELREINKITRIEKPYRLTLLESDMPIVFKAAAMKKVSSLRYMEPGSGEYYKIKNWVDAFMKIPFSEYKTLPLSITDGVEKCHDFMANAQKILDEAVYGLNDAKMQIMQMLGQFITNPKAIGSAIAIHGPPGTGKTSLVKEGISKILNRPFAFIALGGATDSSFLEGHGYTYEGSTWGKIVQILIDSKCMNPVIYFDELDKISDTPKGEEIAGILTHLTDTSQNSQFHDKYFSEIDFDLSKCLFIFSYNDESKINPILKDRMYRIQTKGYNQKQKMIISNSYLLPKIREQVMFNIDDIIIPDITINYIIENHCNKEDGVRNLKRCLEIIYTKLNLYRLMRPDSNLFEEDMSIKVTFPFTVTKDIIDKLIKKTDDINQSLYHLYI
jgi:ATP-dependent Lon protease